MPDDIDFVLQLMPNGVVMVSDEDYAKAIAWQDRWGMQLTIKVENLNPEPFKAKPQYLINRPPATDVKGDANA